MVSVRADDFEAGASVGTSSAVERAEIRVDTEASILLLHFTSSDGHGIDIFQSPAVGDFGSVSSLTLSPVIASSPKTQ